MITSEYTQYKNKLKNIKCLIMDVDGVLTDGRIIIDDMGNETKNFDVKDGHGVKLLMRNDVMIILLTGRTSKVVIHRAKDLGITEVYQGVTDKASALVTIMNKHNLKEQEIAYIGDDIVDVPILRKIGFPVAVADASEDAKRAACYITKKKGGRGAVREVCELIIKCKGRWNEIVEKYNILIS